MTRHLRSVLVAASIVAGVVALSAEQRAIDGERSTLTVYVYKTGLFSAFADNHVIRARIAGGTVSEDAPPAVELTVRASELTVLDPGLAANKRAEVERRMLSADVLDVVRFPEIVFASTEIEPAGADRWRVSGRLTIHGATKPIGGVVTRRAGRYQGSVTLRQRDFGIEPISIVGGTVKVKDEVKVEFDLVTR